MTRRTPDLPDTARLEHIQYRICVRGKIERGLRDVEAGRVVNQNKATRRMGHSTITMTMRYAHLAPGSGADLIRGLDANSVANRRGHGPKHLELL